MNLVVRTGDVPCSILRPSIMRTVNRRAFVTNLLTFSMSSSLTEAAGLSLRGLLETLPGLLENGSTTRTHTFWTVRDHHKHVPASKKFLLVSCQTSNKTLN
ncbi:hypothetical protein TNCV_272711 [Trichonephila clavipes]|nr:hypothetical protein TNCV_272711 [Trichonephila clavipes]